ncbi:preprotein translocase subunit SecY [Patescibacteria group bacterium]|nr:preprotein translocase subunit SecY [Patescibacteria group bacterium]MBU1703524.1 preprotein translocase subunit SecY [Patescibacteria group bacterium]MBU1953431.1 preprotein translocase subunit SecY [Patescibacteria group bacterium]
MNYLLQIWKSKDLRNKILFTLGLVVIFRILAQISLPGANTESLKLIFQQNQLLGMFSMLTGGSAENFSIILMGLSPYINASIIMQLLTVIVPRLESLSKEGEQGQRKINQYTRWITVPIAFLQSYGMIALLNSQSPVPIIENITQPSIILPIMLTVTTGSILLMWLGELMTEKGLGNGVSVLIFAGIVASIPTLLGQNLALVQQSTDRMIPFIIGLLVTLALTIIVILVTEGQRNIPITYAGRGIRAKGIQSALPLRVNQAGMIPIIFGISVISFPGLLASFFQNSTSETFRAVGSFFANYFNESSPLYIIMYFLLVIAFTFFYVSITFNPEQVAENIQKRGGYIPGIRPGKETADYLGKVSNRLNLWGGLFIGIIAISPLLLSMLFLSLNLGSVPLLIGGAGLIIVVGVVLELLRQINAQMVMHDYNKLY